jgi:phage terminase large subunit-like protein
MELLDTPAPPSAAPGVVVGNRFTQAAQTYALRVLAGEIPVCKWTRLAIERQLGDLQRAPGDDWPWVFDAERAAAPCEFLELLPHIKGKWARARELIALDPWQCFILTAVFGWVHRDTGLRRFREVYIEVPRKNAKSTLSSGVALFMLAADGEHGAEVYSAATTREQARIVFDVAKSMAERTPDMRTYLGVAILTHSITVAHTASKFSPLAAEGSTLDGLNVHFAVIDELHAHKTRAVYDVIDTGRGAREQSLLWIITTAGTDRSGICYERRSHITKVLDRVIDDQSMFGVIYSIDDTDDPLDRASWAKANPNWLVSVLPDDMEAAARKAAAMPSALNNFLTKRLNVWVNGGSPWMPMRAWERCADDSLRDDAQFDGLVGFGGLDLAQKTDFAAKVKVFERDGIWNVCTRLYYNQQAVEDSPNAQMSGWVAQGHVQVNEGNLTDFDVIAADMRDDCKRHDMREIAFDPALSMYFAGKLVDEGLPMVEIAQRAAFFTQVLLQVENMVLAGTLRHDNNPVMNWMISNLVVKVSKFNELRQPTKDRPENKIDGAIALLMALGRALALSDNIVHSGDLTVV